jgi:hypothetical protein
VTALLQRVLPPKPQKPPWHTPTHLNLCLPSYLVEDNPPHPNCSPVVLAAWAAEIAVIVPSPISRRPEVLTEVVAFDCDGGSTLRLAISVVHLDSIGSLL